MINQLLTVENLKLAFIALTKKKRVPGVDNISIKNYQKKINENLLDLIKRVKEKKYIPKPVLQYKMRKTNNKFREIAITSLEDAILQKAVVFLITPKLERYFIRNSYAYRSGKGHSRAIGIILHNLQAKKYTHIATADINSFFDCIIHDKLLYLFKTRVTDDKIIVELIKLWLINGVISNQNYKDKNIGIYQGYIISPILSNLYLTEFDKIFNNNPNFLYLRFSDNLLFLTNNEEECNKQYKKIENVLSSNYNLKLNLKDKQITDYSKGFVFLGLFIKQGVIKIAEKKILKAKKTLSYIISNRKLSNYEVIQRINNKVYSWQYHYKLVNKKEQYDIIDNHIIDLLKQRINYKEGQNKNEYIKLLSALLLLNKNAEKDLAIENILTPGIKKQIKAKDKIAIQRTYYKKLIDLKGEWLIVRPGTKLSLKDKSLLLTGNQGYKIEVAVNKIKAIQINSKNTSITTNLIEFLSKYNISVYISDKYSDPIAQIIPIKNFAFDKTKSQINAFFNGKDRILIKEIIITKIKNQLSITSYYSKYWSKESVAFNTKFSEFRDSVKIIIEKIKELNIDKLDDFRNVIMSYEGQIAAKYWKLFALLISPAKFDGREKRNASDIINVMLNYGYGILYHRIFNAIIKTGLNPTISYLHKEQRGKPTLSYDLIESYRSVLVDRTVIKIVNLKIKIKVDKNGKLTEGSRKILVNHFLKRLHSFFKQNGKSISIAKIINENIKQFSQYIVDESGKIKYNGVKFKW